jgi:outer membrane protein TolC
VTAAEHAAEAGVLGSRYAVRDRAARTVHAALQAYWQYRARVALHAVARDSAQRSGAMLASIEKLVAAEERPRADLVLLRADLADKEAAREAAALALGEARRALGRLLGLPAAQIEALPEPAADFPAVSALEAALPGRAAALRQLALAQRPDVRVLDLQQEALRHLLKAAHNGEQPRLDVNMGLGYGRASEGGSLYGFINQPGRTQHQPSVFLNLKFELPIGNHAARGLSRSYAAQASTLDVRQRDLSDSIASGVDSALQALASSASQLQVAQQGLALYEQAVQQELVKQRNGIATLIDVINIEARFVNARTSLLQLQLAHALALARLRFETGSLLPPRPVDPAGADQIELAPGELAGLGPLAHLAQSPGRP